MPASSELARALDPAPQRVPLRKESIVVASDGTEDSDNAIELASAYAERTGATLRAISVYEPVPVTYDWPPFASTFVPEAPELMRSNRAADVEAQLLRLLGKDSHVPVTVTIGAVGPDVAAFADSVDADLIIVGRGRHGLIDRVLGEEHVTRLLRTSNAPVLAAEPTLRRPPRRVVVGIDFSAHSVEVARTATTWMADEAIVYLVHVKPDPPFGIPHPGQWLKSYDDGVRAGLEQVRTQLDLPGGCVVESIVINGHPGVALADFARTARADLVAVGVHGGGFFNRLVIGTVPSYVLRKAPCSLLAVPAPRETAGQTT